MLERSSVAVIAPRASGVLRQAAAISVCALAAHAVAYGSLEPQDGGHRYFAWYAPVVAALSAAALVGCVVALGIVFLLGPTSRAASALRRTLPARSPDGSIVAGTFSLASGALVFLAVQESLERSLAASHPELVSFSPATLVVLVVVAVLAAALVVLVQRIVSSLADVVLLRRPHARVRRSAPGGWHRRTRPAPRLRRPLAVHGGLRAPPLPS